MVWQAVQAVRIPVIGIGGIAEASDALEFLIAGARAFQVGTASFVSPTAVNDILTGIEAYLDRHRITAIGNLIGSLDTRPWEAAEQDGG
jgi:dihydroorotate dehydrogenase (NAD+) catalytic subunit